MKAWPCVAVVLLGACGSEPGLSTEKARNTGTANDAGATRVEAGDLDSDPDDSDAVGAGAGEGTEAIAEPSNAVSAAASRRDAGSPGSDLPATAALGCGMSASDLEERCAAFDDQRPDRLSEHAAVYDPTRRQMLVVGGTHDIPVNCATDGTSEFSSATWVYDDPCGKWVRSTEMPGARGRHSAAWANGSTWVFGGRFRAGSSGDYTLFNDLIRYDGETAEWVNVEARGTLPLARATSSLTWDSKRNQLWMFAGNTAASGLVYVPTNDLWSFDIESETWQSRVTPVVPPARLFHSMFYDAARDWLVVFGGGNDTAFDSFPLYFGDLWAFDIEAGEWLELAPQDSGPRGRFWSSIVHDTDTDSYLVFGGHDPGTLVTRDETLGNLNDVWRFDPDTGLWDELAQGDVFNEPNIGFCNFPPDFALIDSDLPERRNAHSLVWSDSCGHALLFAGKTDCGAADDVWSFAGGSWVNVLGAREGEVCLRWREDPDQCTDICF